MTYTAPAPRLGSKYAGWQDAAAIARQIRADLKAAQRAGDLPDDMTIRVRCHKYAGGQAVDVVLSGWTADRVIADHESGIGYRGMSHEAARIRRVVDGYREAYNRDASDSMVDYYDVLYYGSTEWDVRPPAA